MNYQSIKPIIPSGENFEQSLSFFKHIGFTVNWKNESISELQYENCLFLLQNFNNQEFQNNYMVSVNVENLDEFYKFLLSKNLLEMFPSVRFTEPKEMPWGIREINLIDLAGVCWHFA
jgi:hypothetical protein